jgi:hypothetical protein
MVRRPVGTDLRKAEHERNRHIIILNAKEAGIATVSTGAWHSLDHARTDYIVNLRRRDLTEKSITATEKTSGTPATEISGGNHPGGCRREVR